MKPEESRMVSLHVMNPGGRDASRAFLNGPGHPDDPGHPPVNFHAYAACTHGVFARSVADLPTTARAVLLLLRAKHLTKAEKTLRTLQKAGLKVLISWKESGAAQVAAALSERSRWLEFQKIASASDGFLSAVPDIETIYRAAGCPNGISLLTPYPLEFPEWNFEIPLSERQGIFIGTREFDIPARNHLLAVCEAHGLHERITVMTTKTIVGRRYLESLPFDLQVVDAPLPYANYLRLMASHRIVFQLDSGAVPGQVAGDALLCGMPCVGGNGGTDRLAFPDLCGFGRSPHKLRTLATWLLNDDRAWQQAVSDSRNNAASLGFDPTAACLAGFCQ